MTYKEGFEYFVEEYSKNDREFRNFMSQFNGYSNVYTEEDRIAVILNKIKQRQKSKASISYKVGRYIGAIIYYCFLGIVLLGAAWLIRTLISSLYGI